MLHQYSAASAIVILGLVSTSLAQVSLNCPLLGPVFPPPKDVVHQSKAVPASLDTLHKVLKQQIEALDLTDVSFYLNVFSKDENIFDYKHAAPLLDGSLTSESLDENTIFRIGSVSKLLTVYTLVAEVGMEHMNDPVTKWVPELKKAAELSQDESAVEAVRWDDITVGALAGQIAGLNRDLSLQDLSLALTINQTFSEEWTSAHGLPLLPENKITTCGISNVIPPCSRETFFHDLRAIRPATAPARTPIYSNFAYQILSYALESIAGKKFPSLFSSALTKPLSMTRTYLGPPPHLQNVIIPDSNLTSWWNVSLSDSSPEGGMFSTPADLRRMGQSILRSTLVSPAQTRAWMKPISHTADTKVSVGMPWEIHRMLLPLSPGSNLTRVSDLYTKNGDLGAYSAIFALSPDHEMGWSILLASAPGVEAKTKASNVMVLFSEAITETVVPGFENAAREQAATRFAGKYRNEETGMELELVTNDGRPGLGVASWTMGKKDILRLYAAQMRVSGAKEPSLRLYPMGLEDGGRMAFRGVYENHLPADKARENQHVFFGNCLAWGGVDTPQYGNVGFDDFVIHVDGKGNGVGITPRVARETLKRVE